ncbi:unnamed protein product [Mesocestoides corti]|uniref:Sulfhydryl oxidase n=1 Tax=Mesocestoides corti TaxID=53468 RepID=A0A0R3UGT1_MESCO|nr:unnamed protein product [Mesocestoides corti]
MSRQARLDDLTREEEEKDFYNPSRPSFCRACVDLSTFKKLKPESRQASPYFLDPKGCPVDKTGLGRATWTLLHTMAAYYPNKPTTEEMQSMERFFDDFAKFFPCKYCAADFKKSNVFVNCAILCADIDKHKPDVRSRQALSGWLCMQHNLVNAKTGKPLFDCSKMPEHGRAYLADLTNMPEAPTPPSSTPATTRRKDKFRTIIDFWNSKLKFRAVIEFWNHKLKFRTVIDYWNPLERNLDGGGSGTLGPMERLMRAMREASTLYVVTRGMREIRAILIGRLVAFDRYWNLVR